MSQLPARGSLYALDAQTLSDRPQSRYTLGMSEDNTKPLYGRILILLILAFGLAGCANLTPGLKDPTIKVTRVNLLPAEGTAVVPRLAIGLQVVNPNGTDLSVRGMSYSIALEGYSLASGVTGDVPVFRAFSETPMTLTLTPDVLAIARFIRQLHGSGAGQALDYELTAELDIGRWRPDIAVRESGSVTLNRAGQPAR